MKLYKYEFEEWNEIYSIESSIVADSNVLSIQVHRLRIRIRERSLYIDVMHHFRLVKPDSLSDFLGLYVISAISPLLLAESRTRVVETGKNF